MLSKKPFYWVTAEDKKIRVEDMSDRHLLNAISWYLRTVTPNFPWRTSLMARHNDKAYPHMVQEAHARGLLPE